MCTSESANDEYTTAKQPSRSTIIIYMYYKWRAIETEYYNTFLVMLPLARVFDVDVIILGHESIVSNDFCHFKRFQWFSSRRWCCSTLWLEDFDIEKSDDFTFFRCYSISISLHLEAINSSTRLPNYTWSGCVARVVCARAFLSFFDLSQNMMMSIMMGISIQITCRLRLCSSFCDGKNELWPPFPPLSLPFYHSFWFGSSGGFCICHIAICRKIDVISKGIFREICSLIKSHCEHIFRL